MPYVTEMNSIELRQHIKMLKGMNGWNDPLVNRLFDEIASQDETLRATRAVIREADEYLDTNSFTNIGHGSVLHTKFKGAIGT